MASEPSRGRCLDPTRRGEKNTHEGNKWHWEPLQVSIMEPPPRKWPLAIVLDNLHKNVRKRTLHPATVYLDPVCWEGTRQSVGTLTQLSVYFIRHCLIDSHGLGEKWTRSGRWWYSEELEHNFSQLPIQYKGFSIMYLAPSCCVVLLYILVRWVQVYISIIGSESQQLIHSHQHFANISLSKVCIRGL